MPALISVRDVDAAHASGRRIIATSPGAIVTPAARDRARELGIGFAQGSAGEPTGGPAVHDRDPRLTTAIPELRRARAQLDFVAGLKGYNHYRRNLETYASREVEFEAAHRRKPATAQEALALIRDQVPWRVDQFVMDLSQGMLWRDVLAVIEPHRDELRQRLMLADVSGPGRLELDPDLQLPEYYTATEFHIMPGSYHGDELAGWMLSLGGSIYFSNAYDDWAMQWAIVESLPEGFVPGRVVDVGCSTGASTLVWKRAFPAAEVHGIDLAAPMVRFAHLRGIELGLEVTFRQALAESTGYPDETFDLVTACILTHELPTEAVGAFFREAHRILRPGGLLLNGDIQPARAMGGSSFALLRHDFERRRNGEAYIPEILGKGNLPEIARSAGFAEVTEPAAPHRRTGSVFPWITLARK